eukprot:GILJ01007193.1.p1 GENE.GILJ01007193.1~~GILJ01007193.1.p1  ORF type:complete len:208 (-),score=28.73 GILJ01007193.1:200-742(-)
MAINDDDTTKGRHLTFQVKHEELDKSLRLHIIWSEGYPDVLPSFQILPQENDKVTQSLCDDLVAALERKAEELKGEPMTFAVVQHLKDNMDEWGVRAAWEYDPFKSEPSLWDSIQAGGQGHVEPETSTKQSYQQKPVEHDDRKHLSKGQKRTLLKHTTINGEEIRGWNWVDIISHLSKVK